MEAQKVLGCFCRLIYFYGDLVLVERLCKQDAEDIMAYLADVFPAGSRSRRLQVIRSWIIYMERLEKEHRLLKKQQKFLSLHRRVIDEQIQSMEENQKLIRQQMKEIENLKGQTFSKERAENYLRRLETGIPQD